MVQPFFTKENKYVVDEYDTGTFNLTVSDRDLNITTVSGQMPTEQEKTTDDRLVLAVELEKTGDIDHSVTYQKYGEVGYANLSSILRLPFSVIKMDRSLLQGISENENHAAFYRSMIDTLHDIGYQIVSEGAETEQEAELLAEWKVDMIQGYYYAKPQPEKDVLAACKAEQNI